jgi:hypothetical protein
VKLTLDQIRRSCGAFVGYRPDLEGAASNNAAQPQLPHQPLDGAARDGDLFPMQLTPNFLGAVDAKILVPHSANGRSQHVVALGPFASLLGIAPVRLPLVVRRWGNRQDLADWLDPVRAPVLVDEIDHYLGRRSSSACAK